MSAGGIRDDVRVVIDAADRHARGLGHGAIAPVHVLLGLLAEEAGHAAASTPSPPWRSAGLLLDDVRALVAQHADDPELAGPRSGDHPLRGGWGRPELPVTAHGRGVLDQALRRALPPDDAPAGVDRRVIVPAHLLLGLLGRPDTVTALALDGVDTAALTRDAERLAVAAPALIRETRPSTGVPLHTLPDGRTGFSIFGWPSRWSWDGPAAQRVLARAEATGRLDREELLAAAQADAGDPPGSSTVSRRGGR